MIDSDPVYFTQFPSGTILQNCSALSQQGVRIGQVKIQKMPVITGSHTSPLNRQLHQLPSSASSLIPANH